MGLSVGVTLAVCYLPAICLFLVQVLARRPQASEDDAFPMLGLDAHITAVALVMSVTLSVANLPNVSVSLLVMQLVIASSVTSLLAITAMLHRDKKKWASNILGVSFLVFAVIWVFLVVFLFVG